MYENLSYSSVTFKAAHNSEERKESVIQQITQNSTTNYDCGCRGIELDVCRYSSTYEGNNIPESFFIVQHERTDKPEGSSLAYYLELLNGWHNTNPNHDPILITIDIKSQSGDYTVFPNEFNTYLECYFNASLIYTPYNLVADTKANGFSGLQNALNTTPWPTIQQLSGKFIFCLSGTKNWKDFYAYSLNNQSLCFSDLDIDADGKNIINPGCFVFYNLHIYNPDYSKWSKTLPMLAKQNIITRGYEINSETNWDDCIAAGLSVLATNKISGESWAQVDSSGSDELFIQRNIPITN